MIIFYCKLSSEEMLSLLKNRDHPKFPADINQLKNTPGTHQFYRVSEMDVTTNTKSCCNLHPRYSSILSDAFLTSGNEHHFFSDDTNSNRQTCESAHRICKKILAKQGKIRGELLFQIGLLINKDTCVRFSHINDSELSCYISGYYYGFWTI